MTLELTDAEIAQIATAISGAPFPTSKSTTKAIAALDEYHRILEERGYVVVPREATDGLLVSMALRSRHDFGLISLDHRRNYLVCMRQLHEEVVGTGFYSKGKETDYRAMIEVTQEG